MQASHYQPPLEDFRFVQQYCLQAEKEWCRLSAHQGLDQETADRVLEAAGRFCADVLAPLNGPADLQGCRLEHGRVLTPDGFAKAYADFVEAGWPALACDPSVGGQGLPQLLDTALHEMLASANHGWAMYPGILHGAYACLHAHGDDYIRRTYLPPIVSGRWLATMCLTEPQAGSDLGLLRTQALPEQDGSYRLHGNKIFISGGDQDMSENIVHLVLARLPDAPAGTRGLSLFLAPRLIPQEQGLVPNTIYCDGIEKKMGIKGSATCTMRFEAAQAWLLGKPHQGLAAMFVMMNSARLHVGLQGLGHAEAAWQLARVYAHERHQMRVQPRPVTAKGAADPIAHHPAMQRILADLRVWTEGMRVMAAWTAHQLDLAQSLPEGKEQTQALNLASLLTPVVKSFFTERGFGLASDALQVFGGYGYVHEYRIEQTLRDVRIAMIYEGTNQIQALDLLQRKIAAVGPEALQPLLQTWRREADACLSAMADCPWGKALRQWSDHLHEVTTHLCSRAQHDTQVLAWCAEDYLRLVGTVCMAFAWARAGRVSRLQADTRLCERKVASANYFFDHGLLDARYYLSRIEATAASTVPMQKLV
ncbi:acyl-CoA dehydrogenase [Alcaligenes aquatilis]|uniref:3-methylmercaptopropionyl-CoA dehydrogenase n=1 Tax=Alcaligenes aquatilis TaxID=323284 RepID=A0A3G2HYF0_9BURK|nr:acyl-CoA dehydrogenase [Alcaligenes aquatilis]AYN22097.1 acyl-CoA dehydrogenase [Alcaligenes aquatilis]